MLPKDFLSVRPRVGVRSSWWMLPAFRSMAFQVPFHRLRSNGRCLQWRSEQVGSEPARRSCQGNDRRPAGPRQRQGEGKRSTRT